MGIKSYDVGRASRLNNFNNNSNFNANDHNVNNHNALRGIAHYNAETLLLKPRDLWQELCSVQNLELAFKKARNHKTLRPYVLEFEEKLVKILKNPLSHWTTTGRVYIGVILLSLNGRKGFSYLSGKKD